MQITKDWQGVDIQCGDEITIVQTKKDGKHVWIDEGIKYFVLATFSTTTYEQGTITSIPIEYCGPEGLIQQNLEEILADMLKESPGTYHICRKGINDNELMFYEHYFTV